MKVLVACEESQIVTIAFRKLGHEAYSCDIEDCSGGHPEWHLKQDVIPLLKEKWDLVIAHPPCTYLTNTGARWFYDERYPNRQYDRQKATEFFMSFVDCADKVAIENPIGYMSTHYRKPDQIIQPYWFGHDAQKATCLWLKNLPKLVPTNIVSVTMMKTSTGASYCKWYWETSCLPLKDGYRAKIRSRTFQGIADAMAEQWSVLPSS
jgi:hypothetical protein